MEQLIEILRAFVDCPIIIYTTTKKITLQGQYDKYHNYQEVPLGKIINFKAGDWILVVTDKPKQVRGYSHYHELTNHLWIEYKG